MSTQTATVNKTEKRVNVRYLTVTAMLSAVAYILMFLDFSVPFMPAFIKMDLSELPALIGSFAMGPLCGVVVCLIKNVLHLFITTTGGVGELSNFILGVAFVLPAGLIYKHKKNRKSALIGSLAGAAFMGIFSIISNYFLVYPEILTLYQIAYNPKPPCFAKQNATAHAGAEDLASCSLTKKVYHFLQKKKRRISNTSFPIFSLLSARLFQQLFHT
jgi:riboflavin transporter FmnP